MFYNITIQVQIDRQALNLVSWLYSFPKLLVRSYPSFSKRRSSVMRKLIVNNFVTLDGYYEGKNKNIDSLFDYYHEDYSGDHSFDFYAAERLRAADFLLLSH